MTGLAPEMSRALAAALRTPRRGRRRLIALAGPPASGKSTLAESLARHMTEAGAATIVVPMDGFHLHNQILMDRGQLDRKGAPETFDAAGVVHLVRRLADEDEVFFPVFDRARDISLAAGGRIGPNCDTVVIEGNYLLLDAPVWRDLRPLWDLSIALDVPECVLRERLVARWLHFGHSPEDAAARAEANDLANAALVAGRSLPADVTIRSA
ncbi:AAA family ATPase [Poseidonocella sedimentorum]|uniref:Panthothenate kinase n=1 Tax=Poseidonocella sedimentorum TaxID=871652 RepID=A0A1I6D4N4_9RHOB|nr:AAA family ATPase [Poseidonocella sedimentorum]SFR00405.1 Panthothenate kinase [Poseidonocella sedimentorum]